MESLTEKLARFVAHQKPGYRLVLDYMDGDTGETTKRTIATPGITIAQLESAIWAGADNDRLAVLFLECGSGVVGALNPWMYRYPSFIQLDEPMTADEALDRVC